MTSLRDQLKKLATPATKQLRVDVRKRPSLIYEPHEAAKIDFTSHFERAKEAFDHLCNIDASFKRFENSLFAEDSITYEPSVQEPDVHKRTGKRLQKFLMKISALLQIPTLPLQVLEWLVQRFQVHLYHPDDVIRCVMPYHETALFPKFLQLLDLDAHDNRRWAWLKGIADKGIPLTKDELLLACSRDMNIVLFICHSLEISLKVNRRHPQRTQPALVLFTQVGVGLLTRSRGAEAQLGALLVTLTPALEAGLGPGATPSQRASSFLLLQTLCNQARLQPEVAKRWVGLVLANPMSNHPEASVMLAGLLARRHGLQLSEEDLQRLQELEQQMGEAARREGHLQAVLRKLRLEEEPEVIELKEEEEPEAMEIEEEEEEQQQPALTVEEKKENNALTDDAVEKNAMTEKMKALTGSELVKWLLFTALGGSERHDCVVAPLYALKVLREQLKKDDEEIQKALKEEPVVPFLLLLLLHTSPPVRAAALSCLQSVRTCLTSPDAPAGGHARAKLLKKLLKISDRRLLAQDRLLLLQAPFNLRVLTECFSRLPPDRLFAAAAPEDPLEQRVWLFAARGALQLLDAPAASALQAAHPQLGPALLDLLSAHRPPAPSGAALWAAWKPEVLTVLPPNLRDRGLDLCLEAAPGDLAKVDLSVAQVKRLMTGLLPKKGAISARELILRKRAHASRTNFSSFEAHLPRLLSLLEVLEELPWASSSDAPLWNLVPTFMACLAALATADSTATSPKRRKKPSLSETADKKAATDSSSDSESEVIADYSDDEPHSSSRALAVRRLLSALLRLLRAVPDGGAPSDVPLEPLLDCLAGAFDRQVRQTALLVVSETARLRPALLLHNLLPLLTFMRRHVFPLDDAFTLQVIERVLDCVVPAFIRAGTSAQAPGEVAALRVVAVLADSFHHMPGHRRLPLFAQLGRSIASPAAGACFGGAPWPVLAILADRLSKAGVKKRLSTEAGHFLCRLLASFATPVQLRCAAALLRFLRALLAAFERAPEAPKSPPTGRRRSRSSFCEDPAVPVPVAEGPTAMVLEMVSCGPLSERQALAHTLAAALASHLASPDFLTAFVNCPRGGEELTSAVEALLDESFQLANLSADRVSEEGWRVLLSTATHLLDKVHAFMPFGQHLAVVLRLCNHSQPAVQRKALELLHGRLSALPAAAGGPQALTALSPLLLRAADAVEAATLQPEAPSPLRQAALLCGRELARLMASERPERFRALLAAVAVRKAVPTEQLARGGSETEEEACAYILTAELLQGLPDAADASRGVTERLLPQLEAHRATAAAEGATPVLQMHRTSATVLLVAAAKAAACGWERAQLQTLLVGLARLETGWPASDRSSLTRLRAARRALAEGASSRVLLGALGGAMRELGAEGRWREMRPLLLLLERHVERLDDAGAARLQEDRLPLLCKLCVTALGVRQRAGQAEAEAEDAAIFAVLAVLRRLEEKGREELMGMLFEWSRGVKLQAGRRRQISFFRLCDCLASREPALLVASCTHLEIFDFAAAILASLSNSEEEEEEEEHSPKEVDLLLRSLLSALSAFFKAAASAGASGSLSVDETSQALIPAVTRALELTSGGPDLYRERCALFLLPCLAALAEACGGDEALLRPLCLEVCGRTKHAAPEVRAASLRALTAFAERLGSVFESALLQDALPFMAECLEDDDSDVQELAFEMCERIRRQCGGDVDF